MIIDLTGEVVPCCFWSGYGNSGEPLGNTNRQTLDEIWNGAAWKELRRRNASGDLEGHPCHRCLAWKWSGGAYPRFSWPGTIEPETGHCFTAPISEALTARAERTGAAVELLEDGRRLSPADALHDDIRVQGLGRHSVWGATLYFSSSDNSDPRHNGRVYELACGDERVRLGGLDGRSASGRNLRLAAAEYERGAETVAAHPSMVSFISTADCNIDCPACSQNTVRLLKVQHRERTERDVLALVPHLSQLVWHGGEPWIIRGFREFVDAFDPAQNPHLAFGFTTNGTLLTKEELDKLAKFPRINASISVDSFTAETFELIREGARFDTVLANTLAAVDRYDAARFRVHVGMIVTKTNFTELPRNLAFAMEHGIGLNLSPVVVYPVTERLDVFHDFARQTDGWEAALDEAGAVLERARTEGRVALQRVDPSGMITALREIVETAARRYDDVFRLRLVVTDPTGSLARMRRPGVIVRLDDTTHLPLAYVPLDGPGEYEMSLPRAELGGARNVGWELVHDLLEPMGMVDQARFVDSRGRFLVDGGWREMPSELGIEVPVFEPAPRPRNAALANGGRPVDGALHVLGASDMYAAYLDLVAAEQRTGYGRVDPRRGRSRPQARYAHYRSLTV